MDVSLRDVTEADLETFHEQECDPEAARRARWRPREHDAFITHWKNKVLGDPTGFVQAVVVDGALAGNIVAWWAGERRFIGYWLGREFWGKGVGTLALTRFLELEPTRPLHADPHEGNVGSVRLLERCGFQRTGTDPDGHVLLVLS
ncbi:GNAT family N-acetyltransferase [Nonomuraea sp. SBT364]|uniref:GNAT family N-acetyltransferase n=1 Tax=Nonomuraea sp. SBT364 TaxID=1580530 RepID=UPI000AC17565|nr:GNAT family N-acetyltransferase [Nonomuraea sp. SBT364]